MATTMKGLLKGLRYISQIFDEEKEQEMQIGFPTDVKHVAHIGSDGPATNPPSWMKEYKPQEHENGQVVSRGNSNKYNPQAMNQQGDGLKELLPTNTNEKPKQKTRRKPGTGACPIPNGSPPRSNGNAASSDEQSKHSKHNRSKHGSVDSSPNDQDPSVHRRRGGIPVQDTEVSNHPTNGSAPPRRATSRPRKKGSTGGEASMKKSSKGKPEVDTYNDTI